MATPKATRRPVTDDEDNAPPPHRRRRARAVLFRLLAIVVAVVATVAAVEVAFRIHGDQPVGAQYPRLYAAQVADAALGWTVTGRGPRASSSARTRYRSPSAASSGSTRWVCAALS